MTQSNESGRPSTFGLILTGVGLFLTSVPFWRGILRGSLDACSLGPALLIAGIIMVKKPSASSLRRMGLVMIITIALLCLVIPDSLEACLSQMIVLCLFGPLLLAARAIIVERPSASGVRRMGLVMLAVGGYPWAYTPFLVGGRPGNEGAGMLGTSIFVFVGLPGIALIILSPLIGRSVISGGRQGYISGSQGQNAHVPEEAENKDGPSKLIKNAAIALVGAAIAAAMSLAPGKWALHQARQQVESGADLDKPLYDAIVSEETDAVEYLVRHGAKVDSRDPRGRTPLHMAAMNGHVEEARILIAAGADVNSQCDNGDTPLHLTVQFPRTWSRSKKVAELLLKSGADPRRRNAGGETPLRLAKDGGLVLPAAAGPAPAAAPPEKYEELARAELSEKVGKMATGERFDLFKNMYGKPVSLAARIEMREPAYQEPSYTITTEQVDGVKAAVFSVPPAMASRVKRGDLVRLRGRITGMFYNTHSGVRNSAGSIYSVYEGKGVDELKLVRITLEDSAVLDKLDDGKNRQMDR